MRCLRGPLYQDDTCVTDLLSTKERALKGDGALGTGIPVPFGSLNERPRARILYDVGRVGLDNRMIRC